MTVEELYGQMVDTFQRGDRDGAGRGRRHGGATLRRGGPALRPCMCRPTGWGGSASPDGPGDYLDKHAQLRGLERRAATAAVGVLSFETDHPPEVDPSIPEGTVCMTAAQVRFETTEAGVLKAGQTSRPGAGQSGGAGRGGNAAVGTVRAMAVAPVGGEPVHQS